jgi:hypothetical protein
MLAFKFFWILSTAFHAAGHEQHLKNLTALIVIRQVCHGILAAPAVEGVDICVNLVSNPKLID